jgi:hypothetical protein
MDGILLLTRSSGLEPVVSITRLADTAYELRFICILRKSLYCPMLR